MQNRLKQLPLSVQKHVYEMSGMAGTICSNCPSEEYNHAMGAFLFATPEELSDFLFDHARHNLEHRISWHDVIQEAYKGAYGPQNGSRNVKPFSTVPCDPLSPNHSSSIGPVIAMDV